MIWSNTPGDPCPECGTTLRWQHGTYAPDLPREKQPWAMLWICPSCGHFEKELIWCSGCGQWGWGSCGGGCELPLECRAPEVPAWSLKSARECLDTYLNVYQWITRAEWEKVMAQLPKPEFRWRNEEDRKICYSYAIMHGLPWTRESRESIYYHLKKEGAIPEEKE